jgi:hypothetical protein
MTIYDLGLHASDIQRIRDRFHEAVWLTDRRKTPGAELDAVMTTLIGVWLPSGWRFTKNGLANGTDFIVVKAA